MSQHLSPPSPPVLQRLSSVSSLWTRTLRPRLLSFSCSYFFFHSSAVSSWFTDTVFLMVLALGGSRERRGAWPRQCGRSRASRVQRGRPFVSVGGATLTGRGLVSVGPSHASTCVASSGWAGPGWQGRGPVSVAPPPLGSRGGASLPLSKHERGPGLGLVVDGRRAADDDGGPAVPPQGVLQDPGHLAVPVGDVAFLERHAAPSALASGAAARLALAHPSLAQRRDDVPQRRQRLVDVLGLVQDGALRSGLAHLEGSTGEVSGSSSRGWGTGGGTFSLPARSTR